MMIKIQFKTRKKSRKKIYSGTIFMGFSLLRHQDNAKYKDAWASAVSVFLRNRPKLFDIAYGTERSKGTCEGFPAVTELLTLLFATYDFILSNDNKIIIGNNIYTYFRMKLYDVRLIVILFQFTSKLYQYY